jgi:predicted DNA binding CopG/RHH family protein
MRVGKEDGMRITVTVKLDEELHKRVKIKMAHDGTTIQDYIVQLITKDLGLERKDKK